jgi:YD repeat-containing protein
MTDPSRHGNRISKPPRPDPDPPTVRKVPADSVRYGDSISRNGSSVWAAYDGSGRLICVCATAGEARRKYRAIKRIQTGGGSNVERLP